MAKKSKVPAILTCAETGRTFQYRGYGRPPKYHPDVAKDVQKRQRKAAAAAKRAASQQKREDEAYTEQAAI